MGRPKASGGWDRPWMHEKSVTERKKVEAADKVALAESLGRFPANVIHDGSDEVVSLFPDSKGQQGDVRGTEKSRTGGDGTNCYGEFGRVASAKRGDTGSAARFFYAAKASRKDRSEGLDDTGPKFTRGTTLRNVENAIKSHGVEYLLKDDAPDWVRAEVERLLNQSS